jgi:hypothetical protein
MRCAEAARFFLTFISLYIIHFSVNRRVHLYLTLHNTLFCQPARLCVSKLLCANFISLLILLKYDHFLVKDAAIFIKTVLRKLYITYHSRAVFCQRRGHLYRDCPARAAAEGAKGAGDVDTATDANAAVAAVAAAAADVSIGDGGVVGGKSIAASAVAAALAQSTSASSYSALKKAAKRAEDAAITAIVGDSGGSGGGRDGGGGGHNVELDGSISSELATLTGCPQEGDVILFAVAVCAPPDALMAYKYRLKLTPGGQKKGKASKQAVDLLLRTPGALPRESDCIRAVSVLFFLSSNFCRSASHFTVFVPSRC